MTGTFIQDNEGCLVEVTNLDKALNQASGFVRMHETAQKDSLLNQDVRYYPMAHQYWSHILFQLEKLKLKHSKSKYDTPSPERTKSKPKTRKKQSALPKKIVAV